MRGRVDGGLSVKRSDVSNAGMYEFELDNVDNGRYYIMYRAPQNYRLVGNALPLFAKRADDDGNNSGAYFECVPDGGEGSDYLDTVKDVGDLDFGGYCARSIGCFDVDRKFNLNERYEELTFVNEAEGKEEGYYEGTTRNIVALPARDYLDVGLSEEIGHCRRTNLQMWR